MTLEKKRFDYKWVILVLGFLMVFVCLGFCSSNKGLYLSAITDALGIARSEFSINDSCRFIATAIVNLFFGSLVAKFGVRKMIGFGFLTLIAAMLIYATAESIYVFYIGGTLLGIGLTFTSTTMASSIVRRWFKKDIGKYTGIVFASNGIGGALAAQIVTPMINDENNIFGYRNAYFFVAGLLLVIGILVVCFMKESPKDEPAAPVAPAKKKARGTTWTGVEYTTVSKKIYFYLAMFVVFFTGFSLQGINGAYAAHMKDVGLSPEFVATVASVFSLGVTFSKLLVGAMYDRMGLRPVMLICQGASIVSFVLLGILSVSFVAAAPAASMVMAFIFAILYAIAIPLETLVIPLIVNDLFGSVSYDKLLGITAALNYSGYALGAPIINWCYDKFGTYSPALFVLAIATILMLLVFQGVINSANKVKRAIIAKEEAAE